MTLLAKVRDQLGIRPGTVLEISAAAGRLVAVKRDLQDPFHKWRGKGRLPGGLTVDAYLDRARG